MTIVKYILIIAVVLFQIPGFSYGQDLTTQEQSQFDSLKSIISEPTSHDTSLVAAYVELSSFLYTSFPDTIIPLCLIAESIANKGLSNHPSDAIEKSLSISLSYALNNLGYIYAHQGDNDIGLDYYNKSLAISKKINNREGMAYAYNNIGYVYNNQGIIDKGLEYFFLGLKIREEINDKKGTATSYNNIGSIYYRQADYETGLEYHQKSLTIYKEINDKAGIAGVYNSIGTNYVKQGRIDEALEFFQLSLAIKKERNDELGMAISYHNIGNELCKLDSLEEGVEYLRQALKLAKKSGFKSRMSDAHSTIGKWQLEWGEVEAALNSGLNALEMAQEIGHAHYTERAAKLLSRVYRQQNQFQKALEMYELHIQMRDSINNEVTQKATIRQQTKYEFEKAQLIKEQEQQENERIEAETTGRRDNLQYSVILIAILVLFGGVLTLGFINVSIRMAEGIIFFSFLILFEFLLVLADPYIEGWSGGAPGIKLLFNAGIAALIFPAHAFFESKLKGRLVKNK